MVSINPADPNNSVKPVASPDPTFSRLTITPRYFHRSRFDLQALTATHRSILPQTAAAPARSGLRNTHVFSLSVFAAPNLSFDHLEDDARLAGPGQNRQDIHRRENEHVSFSGGVIADYGLTEKISIQAGLTITSSSNTISPGVVYARPDNNGHTRYELHCSSGTVYISPKGTIQPAAGDSAKTSGTSVRLTYVGIPAGVSFRIKTGRLSFYPGLGVGLNILASGKTTTGLSSPNGNEITTAPVSGLKPAYMEGQIGVGMEYDLGNRISVGIRPTARMALTPINKETPVRSFQNFLSVQAGVRLRF
jgi:hypothetical protein